MTDEELLEQAQVLPLVYCDGFGAYRKVNGVLRCIGFIMQGGATLNLAVSLAGAVQGNAETTRVLADRSVTVGVWSGHALAH